MKRPSPLWLPAAIAGLLLAACTQAPPQANNDATTGPAGPPAANPGPPSQDAASAPANPSTGTAQRDNASARSSTPQRTLYVPYPVAVPLRTGPGARAGLADEASYFRNTLAMGALERRESQLAVERSRNPQVRRTAQILGDDQSAIDRRVGGMARMADVGPRNPEELHALDATPPNAFDRQYLAYAIAGLRDAIALNERTSRSAATEPVRQLASNNVHTLHVDLDIALRTEGNVRGLSQAH